MTATSTAPPSNAANAANAATVGARELPHGAPEILYADATLLVVNKPAGLLSVPGRGEDKQDCLSKRLQGEFPDALIVHRLDMHTSGLLVLARGKEMQRRLSSQFAERQVDKRYVALVAGRLPTASGEIDLPLSADWPRRPRQKVDPLAGKPSLTRYQVLSHDPTTSRSRLLLVPLTGRTHQLRVHLQALGHPIIGDALYGNAEPAAQGTRLMLHAEALAFAHPESGQPLRFLCPAPF
jgi:tRNA pseudouridine32 synthase/23S rRNA pseudouridine746 synthase